MRSLLARSTVLLLVLLLAVGLTGQLMAQNSSASLRGKVADQTGAVIAQSTVLATSATGQKFTATTKGDGTFEIKDLPAGTYTVRATAKGFSPQVQNDVQVVAGQAKTLDIALEIEVEKQEVNVEDQTNQVEVSATNNATQLVLKGADLDALSDDPDDLQNDLLALAGPGAGPNGGEIYIDGFSGGQLPPKSSIREIRINSNPFSAQYDRLGFGRIEVFTKPGTENYHGQFMFNFNNAIFNSKNPYQVAQLASQAPGYDTKMWRASFGGPITKKSSFNLSADRRTMNETSIVNATVLDIAHPGSLDSFVNPTPGLYTPAVPNPATRMSVSPRFDYQVSNNNTLMVRYEWETAKTENGGIGNFNLPVLASNSNSTDHNISIADTQIINTSTINETRFQYTRGTSNRTAVNSSLPNISVSDAFTAGGNGTGFSIGKDEHFEGQNYTSKVHGAHFIKFGGRVRYNRNFDNSNSGYNGSYTFTSLTGFYIAQLGLQPSMTPAMTRQTCLAYLADKQNLSPTTTPWPNGIALPQTENDCGASQFKLVTGVNSAEIGQMDAGLYVEDDWRVKQNVTLSYGLRFETQSNIPDHADFAPRVGVAWGLGKGTAPKTVLRAGVGMFYDRFSQNMVLQAQRANGVVQQNYLVVNPDFYPTVPDPATLTAENTQPTKYQIASGLTVPYTIQSALTLERQVSKSASLAVSYITSRGLHQLITQNINAPLADGTRPYGDVGNIYQYQSAGTFKQQQLMTNMNLRLGKYLSLNGYYQLGFANSNVNGRGAGFPSSPFNLAADWGRASFDTRHRGMIMGTITAPYGIRLNPMLMMSSGNPINITTGTDLNGDSITTNDRPAFAEPAQCALATLPSNIRNTRWGCFDVAPAAGYTEIPINYAEGPGQISFNLRLSKTFALGKRKGEAAVAQQQGQQGPNSAQMIGMAAGRGGGGGRGGHGPGGGGPGGMRGGFGGGGGSNGRYSLTFSASARNVLNHVNPGTPTGNLSSTRFGQSYSLAGGSFGGAANRRIDFQMMFNF